LIKTKEPLSVEQQERLIEVAENMGTYFGVDVKKTVLMFMDTGIHISVMARPEKHNVRFATNPKGKKEMRWFRPKKKGADADTRVILSPRIADWSEEFMQGKRPTYLEFYWHMIKELGRKADMPEISPMTFRHTFAVNMLQGGAPDSVVKQVLNCSEKTLRRYARYSESMIDSAVEEAMGW